MNVSVVVPVYNGARYLGRLLEAMKPFLSAGAELVVVDDGSTDDSARLAEEGGARVIRQANGGPARARNAGWRAATGDVILFTDSDCIPHPDWIGCVLEGFSGPEVGAVAGSYDIANPESPLARFIHAEILYRHRRMPAFVKAGGTYNLAVRREVLERLSGFDEAYPRASGEDNDLCYRVRELGLTIAFRPQALVAHHHPEKMWPYLRTQARHGYWRARLYRRHPSYMGGDDYTTFRDAADVALAGLTVLCAGVATSGWLGSRLGLIPSYSIPAVLPLVPVVGLAVLEASTAGFILKEAGEISLTALGCLVLGLRAFVRGVGFLAGGVDGMIRG